MRQAALGRYATAACRKLAAAGQEGMLEDVLRLLVDGPEPGSGTRLLVLMLHSHLTHQTGRREYSSMLKNLLCLMLTARSPRGALQKLRDAGIILPCPRTLDAWMKRTFCSQGGCMGFSAASVWNVAQRAGQS